MSEPDKPQIQPRPYRFKLGIETSAKGDARPYLEIHSDNLQESQDEFTVLWDFLQAKIGAGIKKMEPISG